MAFYRVDGQANELGIALREFWFDLRHVAQLGRAHGREIFGMRKQNRPFVADPLVKIDGALSGLRLEVRRDVIDSKRHTDPHLLGGQNGPQVLCRCPKTARGLYAHLSGEVLRA